MKAVTIKELQAICARINRITGMPESAHDGRDWNVGSFHLSQAYGGVSLHRVMNLSGGIQDVLGIGHVSKRELQGVMFAFISGLYAAGK